MCMAAGSLISTDPCEACCPPLSGVCEQCTDQFYHRSCWVPSSDSPDWYIQILPLPWPGFPWPVAILVGMIWTVFKQKLQEYPPIWISPLCEKHLVLVLDTYRIWNCLRGTALDGAMKVIFKEKLPRKKDPAWMWVALFSWAGCLDRIENVKIESRVSAFPDPWTYEKAALCSGTVLPSQDGLCHNKSSLLNFFLDKYLSKHWEKPPIQKLWSYQSEGFWCYLVCFFQGLQYSIFPSRVVVLDIILITGDYCPGNQ